MEEKRITSKEGINILEEITKEIDNAQSGSMDSNARADIKKTLELVMEGMNDKGMSPATDNENSRKEEPQDSSEKEQVGKEWKLVEINPSMRKVERPVPVIPGKKKILLEL